MVFIFQAEDGIRDIGVTGVQTCALPIWSSASPETAPLSRADAHPAPDYSAQVRRHTGWPSVRQRSEERRVGKSVDLGGRRIIKKQNNELMYTTAASNPLHPHTYTMTNLT